MLYIVICICAGVRAGCMSIHVKGSQSYQALKSRASCDRLLVSKSMQIDVCICRSKCGACGLSSATCHASNLIIKMIKIETLIVIPKI